MKEAWNAPIVPPSPPPSRRYSHPHIVDNHLSSMHVICVDADTDAGTDDGDDDDDDGEDDDDDDDDDDGDDDVEEKDEINIKIKN